LRRPRPRLRRTAAAAATSDPAVCRRCGGIRPGTRHLSAHGAGRKAGPCVFRRLARPTAVCGSGRVHFRPRHPGIAERVEPPEPAGGGMRDGHGSDTARSEGAGLLEVACVRWGLQGPGEAGTAGPAREGPRRPVICPPVPRSGLRASALRRERCTPRHRRRGLPSGPCRWGTAR